MPRSTRRRAPETYATQRCRFVAVVIALVACSCTEKKPPLGGETESDGGAANPGSGGHSENAGAVGNAGAAGDPSGGAGAADGAPVGFESYFGAGTRLEAIVHSAAGVDRFAGRWFDTELGVPCEFRGASSDFRCLPTGSGAIIGYHLDAACSRPLAMVPTSSCPGATAPTVTLGPSPDACHGYEPYRIVAPAIDAPSVLYLGTPDDCSRVPPESIPTGFALYATQPMAWSDLVGGRFVVRERAPNLKAYVLETDDGAWAVAGFYNAARDEPCWPVEIAGLVTDDRCAPVTTDGSGSLFTEAACESPGVLVTSSLACSPHTPRALLRLGNASATCPETTPYELMGLGESVTGSGYVQTPEGACLASPLSAGTLYALGQAIPLETLPLLERGIVDAGELRLAFHSFGGIPFLPDGDFMETATGEACRPTLFSDEITRCVSNAWLGLDDSDATLGAFFTDAECSGERAFPHRVDPCRPDRHPAGILLRDAACVDRFSEARVAVRLTGQAVYGPQITGPCEPVLPAEQGAEFYVPGESMDPAELFPTLEYATRGQ